MKKRKTSDKTTTIFNLRTDIKNLFKAWCAERGRSMVEVIEEMILNTIKKEKENKRAEEKIHIVIRNIDAAAVNLSWVRNFLNEP